MVRRFSKRRSKHEHANYKIIDSNVMDWANVRKVHTPPSAKRYSPPPPDEHALYKHNFVTGNTFSPPVAALLLVLLTKTNAASKDERAGNGRTIERQRFFRNSLLTSHSVMEMCRSCFINTKYKCLRFELPACNKCLVFKQNEDVEG